LILLGLVGAGLASFLGRKTLATLLKPICLTPAQQLLAQDDLLPQPEIKSTGEDPQIGILAARCRLDQVKALRDENSVLVDQLAKLGLKQGGSSMAVKADTPPSNSVRRLHQSGRGDAGGS